MVGFDGVQIYKGGAFLGIPLVPHSLALFALAMADRYLVGTLIGFEELGVYVLAMQVAAVFSIFFTAFHNAFTPWLFKQLKTEDFTAKQTIVTLTYCYFVFFLAMGSMASSVAPSVISILAGKEMSQRATLWCSLFFRRFLLAFISCWSAIFCLKKRQSC